MEWIGGMMISGEGGGKGDQINLCLYFFFYPSIEDPDWDSSHFRSVTFCLLPFLSFRYPTAYKNQRNIHDLRRENNDNKKM